MAEKKPNGKTVVSACLAGIDCRYDGKSTPDATVMRLVADGLAIPVCPEMLGGLSCPRPPCEIAGGRVMSASGEDVTEAFEKGALEALRQAAAAGCLTAILKARSPSCGSGMIYDGTFTGRLIPGDGLFAAALKKNGFEVFTEEDLAASRLV